MKFWKTQGEILKQTFRGNTVTLLLTTLFDLLFWVLSTIVVLGLLTWLNVEARKLPFLAGGPQALTQATVEQATQYYNQMVWFAIVMIIVILLCIILPILFYTGSRYAIWLRFTHKKFQWKTYWKLFLMQIVWLIIWCVPFMIAIIPLLVVVRDSMANNMQYTPPYGLQVLFWSIFCIMLYYSYHLYYYYMESGLIFASMGHAFAKGTKSLGKRWFSGIILVVIFLLWVTLSNIMLPLQNTTVISILQIIMVVLTLVLLGIMRLYFYNTIHITEVQKLPVKKR